MGKPGKAGKLAEACAQAERIAWPALRAPVLPLEIVTLLEDQIWLVPHFFLAKDCAVWAKCAGQLPLEPSRKAQRGEALRTNARIAVQDADFADSLWRGTGLASLLLHTETFRKAQGLNANIRVYSYAAGERFEQHYDDSVRVGKLDSRWTLLLYLTGVEDGVQGGETAFYPERGDPIVVEPQRGMLLLHKHGSDCLLHEGREVLGPQRKLVLRSDVMF